MIYLTSSNTENRHDAAQSPYCVWSDLSLCVFHMATGTLVNERLPSVLGILPSTLERMLRALQVAELLPKGRPGGGRKGGAAHLEPLPLAYVMIGCAGLQPSEAPNAVLKLRALPYYGSFNPPDDVGTPLPTLEDQLVHLIIGAGAARRNNATWFPDAIAALRSWELQMSLDPLFAVIQVETSAGETRHIYSVDPNPRPGLRRQTILSGDVLMAVGELWADTEKHLALTTPSFLAQARANASPESKSAGHPCQEVPTLSGDQPRANKAGSVLTDLPKISVEPEGFKDVALAGLVTAPLTAS